MNDIQITQSMDIYGLIRAYRQYLGLSQKEFGAVYGLSHVAISDIERRRTLAIKGDLVQAVVGWLLTHQKPTTQQACEEYLSDFIDYVRANGGFGFNIVDYAGKFNASQKEQKEGLKG